MQSRLTEGLQKGEKMQVSSKVNSGCYPPYRRNTKGGKNDEFTQTMEFGSSTSETTPNVGVTVGTDSQEVHRARMSQKTALLFEGTEEQENIGAVTIAECEDEGEFLGITMVPEEGQKVTYGMRAMLSSKSTPDNPIVQVVSNLGGKKQIYNVAVNKVDPNHATQLEMFALLSYSDKMGITDGGTFGSHQQLETYAKNAELNGYCKSLAGEEVFLSQTYDWTDIVGKMMNDYQEAELDKEYEECKKLYDYFLTFNEGKDYQKILREKMEEILAKIKSGDTEPTYRIGAQTFTEKEWDEFLERFDSLEDAIRELMRERFEKVKEAQEEQKIIAQAENSEVDDMLFAESTTCTYPTQDPTDEDIRYITWYTKEGIFCRKAGQTEGYEWSITFENKEQYEKVMELIGQFPDDWNMRFAAHENFWTDFLNGAIDMEAFLEFMQGTNKGVPDYSRTFGDSMYVDETKVPWAKYLNPLGSRFYTAEEFAQQEIINKYGDIFGDEKVTKVIEMEVVTLSSGVSLHFNNDTNEVSCTDDRPGRNYLWTLHISKEDRERSKELFERHQKDGHWEYEYAGYLEQKSFWEAYLSGETNLETIKQMKAAGIENYVSEGVKAESAAALGEFVEVATENYRIVPHNDEDYFEVYIKGERAGAFFYSDINIKRDQITGTEVLLSSHGTGAGMYNVIPMDEELNNALCKAMGCEELEVEALSGYSVKTHRGTGIQYVMKDGAEGRGGKVLLRSESDVAKYNALAEEYYNRYPNLVTSEEFGRIYASFEICGMAERTATGIVRIGFDNISYNDNENPRNNWSVMLTGNTWELLYEWFEKHGWQMAQIEEFQSWMDIFDEIGGSYERIWSDEELKQG